MAEKTIVDVDSIFERSKESFIPKKYKCTIVSLLPWEPAPENKPHLNPSTFVISEANPKLGIGVTHVTEASYCIADPFTDRNTRVPVSPNEVARSVVEDYINGQMCLDEDQGPGLFWVEGELNPHEVIAHFAKKIEQYKQRQIRWFKALVALADADFVKNRNRLAISDIQIEAAKAIGYKADWVDFNATLIESKKCQFCQSSIPNDSVKCQVCHEVVDNAAYLKMKEGI